MVLTTKASAAAISIQTAEIDRGRLVIIGRTVPNVVVRIEGTTFKDRSDRRGEFSFRIGYLPEDCRVKLRTPDQLRTVVIKYCSPGLASGSVAVPMEHFSAFPAQEVSFPFDGIICAMLVTYIDENASSNLTVRLDGNDLIPGDTNMDETRATFVSEGSASGLQRAIITNIENPQIDIEHRKYRVVISIDDGGSGALGVTSVRLRWARVARHCP